MLSYDFVIKAFVVLCIALVLAYFIPGLVLRAIRDFKNKYSNKEE